MDFLNEVSSVPLQQALRNLSAAYANFHAKRAKHPRFKSRKKSRATATYTRSAFRLRNGQLTLAKMSEPLAIVWSRPLPDDTSPTTVTVSKDAAGRWFVSIICEERITPLTQAPNDAVGLDVGLASLATLSTGEQIANPRHERRDRERLAKARREFARKQKGSVNRERARVKVARIHARIADRRRDHLHKLSTRLVRENQAIVIEDLNVRGMVANHAPARAISDAAWSELRRQLEYKCAWYGRQLVVADRFLPSSKACSSCGAIRSSLPLDVRAWACDCGVVHDRDANAARNILAAGLAVIACGGGVSPTRSTPARRLSAKQETDGATRETSRC